MTFPLFGTQLRVKHTHNFIQTRRESHFYISLLEEAKTFKVRLKQTKLYNP